MTASDPKRSLTPSRVSIQPVVAYCGSGISHHPSIELAISGCQHTSFSDLSDKEDNVTTKLHIGNIPRTTTPKEIEGLFRPFGLVASVILSKDSLTGQNTGCGVVEMDIESDAILAIDRLNFSQFEGKTIGVSQKRDT